MGQPSQIDNPLSWKDWFKAMLNKIKATGAPSPLPEADYRMLRLAFMSGWNSRGNAESFVRTQMRAMHDSQIDVINNELIATGKEIEDEHNAMDDLMDDLQTNPLD